MTWPPVAILVLIAWGALAFGAVYPWAYQPLFVGAAIVGCAGLLRRNGRPRNYALMLSAAAVLLAIAIQLVPLSSQLLQSLTPETDRLLRGYVLGYPAAVARHPLSVQPDATLRGLVSVAALCLFAIGSMRAVSRTEALHIVRGVCVIGALLAIIALAQKATWNGKIYGFWTPLEGGNPFGPFVNRNHFAGWILMALPLALGYLGGRVAHGMRFVRPDWRSRLGWFSTADAAETILVAFSIVMMALALAMSLSRSGVLGLLIAIAVAGGLMGRRQSGTSRRLIWSTFLVLLATVPILWSDTVTLMSRLSATDIDASFRATLWSDALAVAWRFPLTGTGFNTYNVSSLFFQSPGLGYHFAQAHNDYLQLLAEGGLLVSVPVIGVGVLVGREIRSRVRAVSPESIDYWIRVGALTGLLAISVQELAEFSLQMPGNALLCAMLIALAGRYSRPRLADDRQSSTVS